MRLSHLLAGMLGAAPMTAHAQGALQTVLPSQTTVQPGASTAQVTLGCVTAAGADVPAGLSTTCGAHGTTGIPVAIVSGAAASAPYPCTASTVGTTPTLILDSVANNTGRSGGGFVLPATATAPVEYQWANASTGLTTTPGGIVYQVLAGGQIPFAGAPNSQLWMISTASQAASCQYTK